MNFNFNFDVFIEAFIFIFQRIYGTGSYFDGLRVKSATEFDLNLLLDLSKIETMLNVSHKLRKVHN